MFKFSKRSFESLKGVDPRLICVAALALFKSEIDFVVTEGLRSAEDQLKAYKAGLSKIKSGGKHQQGKAIDIYPYPIPSNLAKAGIEYNQKQKRLAEIMKESAKELGVNLRAGIDWKSPYDPPHFEVD
jgi:peptidoglycan L-alanyl-D-glutamate endopeptidase CwlK